MIAVTFIYRSSSPGGLIAWCVIGFCAGIYLFFRGFRLLQRRRLILDTPFSKIRSASMGMVEISGLAVGPYTLLAPITARPCFYYRTLVWEWKQSGKSKQWVKVAGECVHVPFFLDDNSGRVLVDPRGADLDLHRDFEQEFCDSFFTTKEPTPSNVRSFLAKHGIVTSNKIKVEEFCIKPKNSLFILGTLAENPGLAVAPEPVVDSEETHSGRFSLSVGSLALSGSLAFSASAGADHSSTSSFDQRLALLSASAGPSLPRAGAANVSAAKQPGELERQKVANAMLRAGISNPAAWAAAGVAPDGTPVVKSSGGLAVIADPKSAENNGFEAKPPVVLMKGQNNKTFLISWRSQQEIARSLEWKCTLMIWGGPALALVSLYVLQNILHLL
jgi:hypothetical protein